MDKSIEIKTNSAELNVLYLILRMFKYGVGDEEDKRLLVMGSPLFRSLFETVTEIYYKSLSDDIGQPFKKKVEYIEDKENHFNIMKGYLMKYKKGISSWENLHWSDLSMNDKEGIVINLAYPYLIRKETINELISE